MSAKMDIYPVHLLDNAANFRNLFLSYVFTFNDVLDPEKLASSLSDLLHIGDWRKLGGRFRFNKAKRLEIHVPHKFTDDVPAITFSKSVRESDGIDSHRLGAWLRAPENHCTVEQSGDDLRGFTGVPSTPQSMKEMMDRDAPLLSLHVTVFADATVAALSWPHALMDAMGLQALLRNWSLVLNDRADEVEPLLGNHEDPLQEVLARESGAAREDLVLEKHSLRPAGLIVLLFRMLCKSLWKETFETRTIVLEPDVLDRFCRRARADVAAAFISEGDVFTGWAAKMLAASQSTPRPVSVATIINLRFRLEEALGEQKGQHVSNLLQFAHAILPPSCAAAPAGVAALDYRRQVAEQSTRGQVLSYVAMQRRQVDAKGALKMLYCDPWGEVLTTNNLSRVGVFRAVDFAGAVVRRGGASAWGATPRNPPGTVLYYHPLELTSSFRTSHLRFLGREHGGRTLLTGSFPPRAWELMRKDLETL
ncbi:BCL5p [Cordyceps javanica]|uniref:BCL5p n=1 Tax=Cordyceps javanica TaxID=43265 RepID=A0A545UP55_9HYPO|nr:BCL5p [Cordyceps javanica]TQW02965.1 BCL5p [Cordyceps javanica]